MAKKKHHTDREINDKVAQDALRYGGKSGPVPTHPSFEPENDDDDDDANATDAEDDDAQYDDDAGDKGY